MIAVTRGKFITLEGGEGAGKSTLARAIAAGLAERGCAVDVTREPGGTANAELIRQLLVSGDTDRWSAIGETLLLYAARADHVQERILPAMERGEWVVCDRFADSTRAYQGAGGKLDDGRIAAIHEATLGEFEPDLTLIVDLDPVEGLRRAESRGEASTRFERRDMEFHAALRAEFLAIAKAEPERCALLDGALDPETLAGAAMSVIEERLGAPR